MADNRRPLLELVKIGRSFGDKQVLENLDLKISPGEFVCLLGPSGCGKSTLLKIMASLDQGYSGDVKLNGTPVSIPGADRVLLFQDARQIFPWLTIEGNVAFTLKTVFPFYRKNRKAMRCKALEILRAVGLNENAPAFPYQLSGGMRQRAALARALAAEPAILLMDEPFSNLDREIRQRLRYLILELKQITKNTIVFVTHDVEEALFLADRVVCMNWKGTIVHSEFFTGNHTRDIYSGEFLRKLKEYDQLFRSELSQSPVE